MTKQEAIELKSFKNYCSCDGFQASVKGKVNPHEKWCDQYEEYEEWIQAIDDPDLWLRHRGLAK